MIMNMNSIMVGKNKPFTTKWAIEENETLTLPTHSSYNYNCEIDWGDGVVENYTNSNIQHNYVDAGNYTIKITGTFECFNIGNGALRLKILNVSNWGDVSFRYLNFWGASNCQFIADDELDVSLMSNMYAMFSSTHFNQNINNWNVSNVTSMRYMFYNTPFNQDISSWNVGNVTRMEGMFQSTPFNQDISNWDVGKVTTTYRMFQSTPFNQDISNWNVGNVTNMGYMFQSTPFNQDISSWNVGKVTNMEVMFYNTPFNQDISNWNVSNVTKMRYMFYNATLSTTNYDALLIGWEVLTLKQDVNFHAGNSKYTAGGSTETARQNIIDNYNWTITDGGSV